jgi:hypothetical protein
MSSVTAVSETDLRLFKRLSNPVVCDVEISVPSSGSRKKGGGDDKGAESMKAAVDKAAEEDEDVEDKPSSSALRSAMSTQRKREDHADSPAASPKKRDEEKDSSAEEEDDARPKKSAVDVSAKGATSDGNTAEERMEKQAFLIELQQLEKKGVTLSRTFSMSDSVAELEFEVTKQNAGMSTTNSVAFMRDSMKLVIAGVEIGNAKLGPFLSIDGWSSSVSSDMHRYDHALERIHKRYFRKQQLSPILELAWLLLGSLVMFHVKNKIFGVSSSQDGTQGGGAVGSGLGGLIRMFTGGGATNPAPPGNGAQGEEQGGNGPGLRGSAWSGSPIYASAKRGRLERESGWRPATAHPAHGGLFLSGASRRGAARSHLGGPDSRAHGHQGVIAEAGGASGRQSGPGEEAITRADASRRLRPVLRPPGA